MSIRYSILGVGAPYCKLGSENRVPAPNGRGVAPDDHWYTEYATEFSSNWL